MFLNKARASAHPLACILNDHGYSLVSLKNSGHIEFHAHHYFKEASPAILSKCLSDEVNKYRLFDRTCQLILPFGSYELLLMDALNVPEPEMAKALSWQLKGLVDYPLNDIAVDTFMVPEHGIGLKRKKVFVAVALRSKLLAQVALLENAYLRVRGISIAELALSQILSRLPIATTLPLIIINHDNNLCQLHVYFNGQLYLSRHLNINSNIILPNSAAKQDMLLEIQRSIDYCLTELKFPEPKNILFTPSFYQARDLLFFIQEQLDKHVDLIDINALFSSKPIPADIVPKVFYAIGGAFMLLKEGT